MLEKKDEIISVNIGEHTFETGDLFEVHPEIVGLARETCQAIRCKMVIENLEEQRTINGRRIVQVRVARMGLVPLSGGRLFRERPIKPDELEAFIKKRKIIPLKTNTHHFRTGYSKF